MKRRRNIKQVASVLCLLVGLLPVVAPQARSSTLPGRNGRIAALSYAGLPSEIGIVTGGHKLRRVYRPRLSDVFISSLSFSPSGARVAFAGSAGSPQSSLAILNLKRNRVEPVGTKGLSVGSPAFLANGNIVFSGARYPSGRNPGTFEIKANGGRMHRLFTKQELAVSPNGRWFISTDPRGNFHTLFLLNHRGQRVRRLTTNPAYRYIRATFSPDGLWIAYEREIERRGQLKHHSDIFIVHRNGDHRRQLTFGGNSSDPAFSPNGRWIAFAKFNSGAGGNLAALSLRHPNKLRILTRVAGARFQGPAWAPRSRTNQG